MAGLNEILLRLDKLADAFDGTPALSRLAFLIRRSAADFETATDAALAGYLSVAMDAMRDVMEIDALLRDFSLDSSRIDRWLTADPKVLMSEFAPVKVRSRLHAGHKHAPRDSAEARDYQGHSMGLHVDPRQNPFFRKGAKGGLGLLSDVAFGEMFEHAQRLDTAIRQLAAKVAPDSAAMELASETPKAAEKAWRATKNSERFLKALVEAASAEDRTDFSSDV